MTSWHTFSVEDSIIKLNSDPRLGLSRAEVKRRQAELGFNELKEKKSASPIAVFFRQFKDTMIVILLLAAAVAGAAGEINDVIFIFFIVLMNAGLSASQELRAEKAVAALKKMSSPQATVIREGKTVRIQSRDLVPGDILLLDAGAKVQADARLIEAYNLKLDESSLTGESLPVDKRINELASEDIPLAERINLVHMGTSVVYGRGKAVVINTGMGTELGNIARMVSEDEQEATPLQKKFEQFGKWLAYLALSACAVIFVSGILRGENISSMFLTAVSLAVAAIPEGLPAVVTISLSLGAYRMVRRNAIIRKLPAIETLGSITVICSDKTGTLTQNKMNVRQIYSSGELYTVTGEGYKPEGNILRAGEPVDVNKAPDLRLLLLGGLLCNDASLLNETIIGDPTEGALVVLAAKAGIKKEFAENIYPRINEIPFDSGRKRMTTMHSDPEGGYICFGKGAINPILDSSDTKISKEILAEAEKLARSGMRLLGVSYKKTNDPIMNEAGFTFLGFVAITDPPRPEVKKAVSLCRTAHIRPIMITGDHRLTALNIAREVGLTSGEDEILEGIEVEKLGPEELKAAAKHISIYARVSPEHKLRIVDALRANGEIVAMTGDGVNDAPALKKADIGVAMGISGTDVSKEASDMVLIDDNFSTIVSAIEEGRGIYDNIRKFIKYMLSTNSGELLTMFGAVMLGIPLPLLPVHILWINLVTDGLPALALSVDPVEKDIMERLPRDPKEKITSEGLLLSMAGIGTLMAAGTILLFLFGLNNGGIVKAQTMAFTALALFQLAHALNCRSLRSSLFRIGIFSNPYLIAAVIFTAMLQMAVIYLPVLQGIFRTTAISFAELMLIVGVALTPIPIVEIRKLISLKRRTQ